MDHRSDDTRGVKGDSFITPSGPELDRLVNDAVQRWTTAGVVIGCRHVVARGEVGWLCACHAGAGLLCRACADRHVRRHSEAVESGCDVCGAADRWLHGVNSVVSLAGLRVRDTVGHSRVMSGLAGIYCLGACEQCFRRLRVAA